MGDFPELQQGEVPFLLERLRLFGPVFTWKLATETVVAVLEYNTIKSLLQHDGKVMAFWSPPGLQALGSEASNKAMASPAARIAQRKTLAPGFSRQALRQVIGKVERICRRHLEQWAAADAPIDLAVEGRQLAFDFSTQLLVNFDVPEEQRGEVKAKLDAIFKAMMAPPVNLPGTTFRRGIDAKAQLLADIKAVIRQGDASGSDGASAFELSLKSHRANQGGAELSEDTIAESGISLLLAGTDTSGGGSTAALAMLAQFPEAMQRLRQEQQQVIAEHGPALSLAAVDSMAYAEGLVSEALRLAPPAGALTRKTLVHLEIGGKFIPAGSVLYLSTFVGMNFTDSSLKPSGLASLTPQELSGLGSAWRHVDQAVLQSEFKPERWLRQGDAAPQGSAGKPSGLLTFGSGPHVCLGMTLFMVEAKVLLALLARDYDMRAEAPQQLQFDQLIAAQLQSNAGSCVRVTKLAVPVTALVQ
ncbi:cytochrome P450 [Scenedesmus sp. NREL 46B-D3]|nr:cytochrome P450 [Scenedesmus sp. NREL 46B-D3]